LHKIWKLYSILNGSNKKVKKPDLWEKINQVRCWSCSILKKNGKLKKFKDCKNKKNSPRNRKKNKKKKS